MASSRSGLQDDRSRGGAAHRAELSVNPDVLAVEYAVRGPIPQRAAALARAGRTIIPCNIGNPQALGQRPLTFFRQVLCLLERPELIARERRLGGDLLPDDVLARAESMLRGFGTGGLGAYTESKGVAFVRRAVADFIDRRDAGAPGFVPADPDAIFLTDGASEGVRTLFDILIAGPEDGIMIPIPQYPLYSAVIRRCGGTQVEYFPDEDSGWTLDRAMLEEPLAAARARGIRVKAIVAINPGNPTGAVLPERSVREVLDFAAAHGLLVIADEVYQENTYGAPFVSFAAALGGGDVPLCSLHSVSKGFAGECGRRGGYLEVRNPPPVRGSQGDFLALLTKMASVNLCSNTIGQAMTYLMVSPPQPGDASCERYLRERDATLAELHAKATLIKAAFAEMEGVDCPGEIGAMYLFPRLGRLPAGTGDFDYCMALLEAAGLCTVNGGGFGQAPGSQHLRIAFLPDRQLLARVLPEWIAFHRRYLAG